MKIIKHSDENLGNKEEDDSDPAISALITVPPDGGWGWPVLFSAFVVYFINAGIMYSYGNIIDTMQDDLGYSLSLISLINSSMIATYYISSTIASAAVNRFGFRFCAMTGAAISAIANVLAYLIGNYWALLILSGFTAGFGYAMANMAAMLILGFYFQHWRAFAFTVAITGASAGIFVFGLLYGFTARNIGWKITILLQASLLAFEYFAAMAFRSPLTMAVVEKMEAEDEPSTSIPKYPKVKTKRMSRTSSTVHKDVVSQRLFKTVSNSDFPTAEDIIQEPAIEEAVQAPSTSGATKLTLIPNKQDKALHQNEIEHVKSIIAESHSKSEKQKEDEKVPHKNLDISLESVDEAGKNERAKKRGFLKTMFRWQKRDKESRPLYRDDVFYEGSVRDLLKSNKYVTDDPLEYQLKVSRAATVSDLEEHRGIFTTAFRRVLATMLNPKPLKRKSFVCICICIFFVHLACLIPTIFIAIRGKESGISEDNYTMFVSFIGFAGIFGRISFGGLGSKVNPLRIAKLLYFLLGIATFTSCYSNAAVFQIIYCMIFGFLIAGSSTVRSQYLVNIYGLQSLSNCTGIITFFQSLGVLLSTPLGGLIKDAFGFNITFAASSVFFFISAICLLPVSALVRKENERIQHPLPKTIA